jgi:hypothetical protein
MLRKPRYGLPLSTIVFQDPSEVFDQRAMKNRVVGIRHRIISFDSLAEICSDVEK